MTQVNSIQITKATQSTIEKKKKSKHAQQNTNNPEKQEKHTTDYLLILVQRQKQNVNSYPK